MVEENLALDLTLDSHLHIDLVYYIRALQPSAARAAPPTYARPSRGMWLSFFLLWADCSTTLLLYFVTLNFVCVLALPPTGYSSYMSASISRVHSALDILLLRRTDSVDLYTLEILSVRILYCYLLCDLF